MKSLIFNFIFVSIFSSVSFAENHQNDQIPGLGKVKPSQQTTVVTYKVYCNVLDDQATGTVDAQVVKDETSGDSYAIVSIEIGNESKTLTLKEVEKSFAILYFEDSSNSLEAWFDDIGAFSALKLGQSEYQLQCDIQEL